LFSLAHGDGKGGGGKGKKGQDTRRTEGKLIKEQTVGQLELKA